MSALGSISAPPKRWCDSVVSSARPSVLWALFADLTNVLRRFGSSNALTEAVPVVAARPVRAAAPCPFMVLVVVAMFVQVAAWCLTYNGGENSMSSSLMKLTRESECGSEGAVMSREGDEERRENLSMKRKAPK